MATFAFANLSGSVGKTTTVVTMGVKLAASGLRVRVIDMDPQANASTWLGYPNIENGTTANVLRREATINDVERPARIIQGYSDDGEPEYSDDPEYLIDNLTVVPAARATLDKVMVELSALTGGVMRLRDALEDADPVDVTLIDGPGSNSSLVTAALIATSIDEDGPAGTWGLITCTKPSGKESEGIQQLLKELTAIKKTFRIDIRLQAIVPCGVPGSGDLYPEQVKFLREGFGDKVTPQVRRRTIVDEAYTNYLPVPLYGHRAKDVNSDYDKVIAHMSKELGMFPATVNV
ncbi:ParA family protein [Mycobacterium sp. NPDC049093]